VGWGEIVGVINRLYHVRFHAVDKCRDGMAVMVDIDVDRSSPASLPCLGLCSLGYETLVDLIDVLLDVGYHILGSLLIVFNGAKRWQSREIHIPENVAI
jgi:hypothetical protein